jgi:hemoglobin
MRTVVASNCGGGATGAGTSGAQPSVAQLQVAATATVAHVLYTCPVNDPRTPLERLGGLIRLRLIIEAFVDEVYDDAMIGFFFAGVNRERLKELELQVAARMLGAEIPYEGRPLGAAHRPHKIMGGQFDRRREILRETLQAHRVPEEIARQWLEHTDALRAQITGGLDASCA